MTKMINLTDKEPNSYYNHWIINKFKFAKLVQTSAIESKQSLAVYEFTKFPKLNSTKT